MGRGKSTRIAAAGAVVRRFVHGEPAILVVHRPRYDDWSLPKGKVDRGETLAETAIREVAEESGVTIRLGPRLPTVAYDSRGVTKHVHYWLADLPDSTTSRALPGLTNRFEPNDEVDAVTWLAADGYAAHLTYDDDRATVAAALALPRTTTILVVRHATAVDRDEWSGLDDERPLLPSGEREAHRLVSMLAPWGACRVVSSPATRCRDTIAPYAATHDVAVELAAELSEEAAAVAPDRLATLLGALVADVVATDTPTVICTHRPVLGRVARGLGTDEALADQLGASDDAPLPPAGIWAVHHDGRRVVAAEAYPPPPPD